MQPRRADLLLGLGGAACGAAAAVLWGGGPRAVAPVIVLGAALGGSRRYPRATWLLAVAVLLAASARGS